MGPKVKVYLLVISQILAPSLLVGGYIIKSFLYDEPITFLGYEMKESTQNWFQQNPEQTKQIVTVMFIAAAVFAVFAVISALSIMLSHKGEDSLGMKIDRDQYFK